MLIRDIITTTDDMINYFLVYYKAKPASSIKMKGNEDKLIRLLNSWGIEANKSKNGEYNIARSKKELELLNSAESVFEIGKAYGYPESAIKFHIKSKKNQDNDISGKKTEILHYAYKQNKKVPSELAYISFIPEIFVVDEELRFEEDVIDTAKKYQDIIRTQYPRLASIIEEIFQNEIKTETSGLEKVPELNSKYAADITETTHIRTKYAIVNHPDIQKIFENTDKKIELFRDLTYNIPDHYLTKELPNQKDRKKSRNYVSVKLDVNEKEKYSIVSDVIAAFSEAYLEGKPIPGGNAIEIIDEKEYNRHHYGSCAHLEESENKIVIPYRKNCVESLKNIFRIYNSGQ